MNIQKIKKAPQRIDVSYLSTLGIKAYGANNLYPQQAKAILDSSSTGAVRELYNDDTLAGWLLTFTEEGASRVWSRLGELWRFCVAR